MPAQHPQIAAPCYRTPRHYRQIIFCVNRGGFEVGEQSVKLWDLETCQREIQPLKPKQFIGFRQTGGQSFTVPARPLAELVVGKNESPLLGRRQMGIANNWNLAQAELLCGLQTAMAGKDVVSLISYDRADEAQFADTFWRALSWLVE
jgi:hypothetical protein